MSTSLAMSQNGSPQSSLREELDETERLLQEFNEKAGPLLEGFTAANKIMENHRNRWRVRQAIRQELQEDLNSPRR